MKITSYLNKSQIRQFLLFSLACLVASQADIPGFGLILIAVWMQIANVFHLRDKKLTKESQIFYLKYFISCVPLILIAGGINGFFPVFWKNQELFKLLLINIIQWISCFLICTFMIFNFSIYDQENSVSSIIIKVLSELKSNLIAVVHITFIFWGINFLAFFISTNDYIFVLNYALVSIYWYYRAQIKPVLLSHSNPS